MNGFYNFYWYLFQLTFVFVSLTGTALFLGAKNRIKEETSMKKTSFLWGVSFLNMMTLILLTYMYIFLKKEYKLTMDTIIILFILYLLTLFIIQTVFFIKKINQSETMMKEYRAPVFLIGFSMSLHFVSLIEINEMDKLNYLIEPFYWSWLISLFLGIIGSIALVILGTVDFLRLKKERVDQ